MKIFNKSFLIGFLSGIPITVLMIFLIGNVTSWIIYSKSDFDKNLKQPRFPESLGASIFKETGTWSFKSLEGKVVSLSDFRGRVIFLNIWSTGCPYCVYELPSIQKLYNLFKNKNITFINLTNESPDTINEFLGEKKFDFPVYLYENELPNAIRISALPTKYIIDTKGSIVFRYADAARWDHPSCVEFLDRLIMGEKLYGLYSAVLSSDTAKALQAINSGIDLNARVGHDGYTFLLIAVSSANIEIVKLLIDKGADINRSDKDGNVTPLGSAIRDFCYSKDKDRREALYKIIKLLLARGADPEYEAYSNEPERRSTLFLDLRNALIKDEMYKDVSNLIEKYSTEL